MAEAQGLVFVAGNHNLFENGPLCSCYPHDCGGRNTTATQVNGSMWLVAATNLLLDFDIFRYALIHSRFTQETDFSRF